MLAFHSLDSLLPDDLILVGLSFVEANDLINFQATCRRYRNLETEDLWRNLCVRRWRDWPTYSSDARLWKDPNRMLEEPAALKWKDRYEWVERDFRRTEITQEELERLKWHFDFLPRAGGNSNGTETRSAAYFYRGRLYLLKYIWMYPVLNYGVLASDSETASMEEFDFDDELELILGEPLQQAVMSTGISNPRHSTTQYVQISSFPPHFVARTSVGGWVLWNENVVLFTEGLPRGEQLPDQLQIHIEMFLF